jgi:hypothetical protein
MNVWANVKKVTLGGMFVGAMMLASSLTVTGCLTDDDKDPDTTATAKDSTAVKTATVGAQSNTTTGSFIELDAWKILKVAEVTTSNASDIDLVFAYSTSADAAGFDFVKTALGTNAASTNIRKISGTVYEGIKTTDDLNAAWTASAGADTKSRLVVANGDAFIAESTKGLKVAIKLTALTATAAGSAAFEGKAKW